MTQYLFCTCSELFIPMIMFHKIVIFERMIFSSTDKVLTYLSRCAKGIYPFIVYHILLWENQWVI